MYVACCVLCLEHRMLPALFSRASIYLCLAVVTLGVKSVFAAKHECAQAKRGRGACACVAAESDRGSQSYAFRCTTAVWTCRCPAYARGHPIRIRWGTVGTLVVAGTCRPTAPMTVKPVAWSASMRDSGSATNSSRCGMRGLDGMARHHLVQGSLSRCERVKGGGKRVTGPPRFHVLPRPARPASVCA